MKHHAIRLKPKEDLRKFINNFAREKNIQAGCIVSCAGSLTTARIRYANRKDISERHGYFEIVSLSGTVSCNGSHLHIAISDGGGNVTGGHLSEGSIVYTTAEVVILELEDTVFKREDDGTTGFLELQIY